MGKIRDRKIDLSVLPMKEGFGANKGKILIDWKHSIGIQVSFIYDGISGTVIIEDYIDRYLYIEHLNKKLFKIAPNEFVKCRFGKLLGVITNEFKFEIGSNININNNNLTILDRKYTKGRSDGITYKQYLCKCNKCGYDELWTTENHIKEGKGCPVCCSTPQIVVSNINSIVANPETYWMIPYFQGGYNEAKLYTKQSKKKIYPICPDCRRIKDKPISINSIYKNHSIGCICGDGVSYPEKIGFAFLDQLNKIYGFDIFTREYSPDWANNKRYDFYFEHENKKYVVEMDGGFHFNDNKMNGQSKEESQQIDLLKDKLAYQHGIISIRIDCSISDLSFIKNNLINKFKLIKTFDLQLIDWNNIANKSLSNLCHEACIMKKNNKNMTYDKIANILNVSNRTVATYIKNGKQVGWL